MRLIGPALIENIRVALRSVRSQILRTILTVAVIAFGIMALVAMLTATAALESKVIMEFQRLGSNTFTVFAKNTRNHGGMDGVQAKAYDPFSYFEASEFKDDFGFEATTSISAIGAFNTIIKWESEKTNPNVILRGVDDHYLDLAGYDLSHGRNFSKTDITNGTAVAIIGADVVTKLFDEFESPINKIITIANYKYTVVGVLASKGTSLGIASDNMAVIPISNLKKNFATKNTEYSINVMVDDPKQLDKAVTEASGLLRVVRGDRLGEEDSFEIEKSDAMAQELNDMLGKVSIGAAVIGVITLIGAGIGLMNIMLVSVTERTREIGVRKSIGATAKRIRQQFLIEAIVIGQLGGLVGILLGVIAGNSLSLFMETPFTIPWGWMLLGVVLCIVTSLISGYYPARKAARLDPIESLRHE
jgi:putative ABC transport system permease protein